ncbi:MAG: hypothetical protein Salg2KO_11080 [Salibacteraceae bacterium]
MAVIRVVYWGLSLIALSLVVGCNATRVIKPLEKGEKQVSAGFGGPGIVYGGSPMPLPLSSISYAHGIDTGVTFTGGIHATSAAFSVLQSDIGLGISAYRSKLDRFGVTITPAVNVLYDFNGNNLRIYPQVDATAWWQYGEKPNLLYGGAGTWIELVKAKAHGQVQENEIMPWISLGHQINRPKWNYLTEVRYIGFNQATDKVVVEYISPADRGTIGIYLGIGRKF